MREAAYRRVHGRPGMPSWFAEVFSSNYAVYAANPQHFLLVAFVAAVGGYFLHGLFYKGKIDSLEERIKLRDEQIQIKDNTIKSVSSDRSKLEQEIVTTLANRENRPNISSDAYDSTKNKLAKANATLIRITENHLSNILTNRTFLFVFNPSTGASKQLTFLSNGKIGSGQNANENTWQIRDGRVEILDSEGRIYSRFVLLDDGMSLHHTNDPDTRSLRGQYMRPIGATLAS